FVTRPTVSPFFPYTTLFRSVPACSVSEIRLAARCTSCFRSKPCPRSEKYQIERQDFLRSKRWALCRFALPEGCRPGRLCPLETVDRKSTRLNSSHQIISYAV